jgi:hypothetical protein
MQSSVNDSVLIFYAAAFLLGKILLPAPPAIAEHR